MTIDATFWVAISFFLFVGLIFYFKVPEKINFTDKLPRTATGKIQRRIVAKHFNI